LTIYEVEGNGELLHQLVESLDSIDVKNSFGEAGLSVLRSIGPQMMPALQDSNWKYEAILILELSWARAITGSLEVIESVEISGTIQNSKSDPDGEKNRYILIEGEKSEDVSTTP